MEGSKKEIWRRGRTEETQIVSERERGDEEMEKRGARETSQRF